jgi:hypothetical protein
LRSFFKDFYQLISKNLYKNKELMENGSNKVISDWLTSSKLSNDTGNSSLVASSSSSSNTKKANKEIDLSSSSGTSRKTGLTLLNGSNAIVVNGNNSTDLTDTSSANSSNVLQLSSKNSKLSASSNSSDKSYANSPNNNNRLSADDGNQVNSLLLSNEDNHEDEGKNSFKFCLKSQEHHHNFVGYVTFGWLKFIT